MSGQSDKLRLVYCYSPKLDYDCARGTLWPTGAACAPLPGLRLPQCGATATATAATAFVLSALVVAADECTVCTVAREVFSLSAYGVCVCVCVLICALVILYDCH